MCRLNGWHFDLSLIFTVPPEVVNGALTIGLNQFNWISTLAARPGVNQDHSFSRRSKSSDPFTERPMRQVTFFEIDLYSSDGNFSAKTNTAGSVVCFPGDCFMVAPKATTLRS